MKRFYGSLVLLLGVVALIALVLPPLRSSQDSWRLNQAAFGVSLVALGYVLSRTPRPTT